jgi:hypothetical protein
MLIDVGNFGVVKGRVTGKIGSNYELELSMMPPELDAPGIRWYFYQMKKKGR